MPKKRPLPFAKKARPTKPPSRFDSLLSYFVLLSIVSFATSAIPFFIEIVAVVIMAINGVIRESWGHSHWGIFLIPFLFAPVCVVSSFITTIILGVLGFYRSKSFLIIGTIINTIVIAITIFAFLYFFNKEFFTSSNDIEILIGITAPFIFSIFNQIICYKEFPLRE